MALNMYDDYDWRYEIKFALSPEEELRLLDWIVSTPDIYRAFPPRQVNSVYLDSLDFDCATANLDGLGWRSKYRLRWYGGQESPEAATFEIKLKRGRMGTKQVCPINLESMAPLTLSQTDLETLFRQVLLSEQVMSPVSNLHPTVFVRYEREYYQGANGIRMTLDRNMAFKWLADGLHHDAEETHQDSRRILEFKFPSAQKDQVAEMMMELPFSAARSSKYILGLAHSRKTAYF